MRKAIIPLLVFISIQMFGQVDLGKDLKLESYQWYYQYNE